MGEETREIEMRGAGVGPMPRREPPAASSAASPPEEPPGVRRGSRGEHVSPKTGFEHP